MAAVQVDKTFPLHNKENGFVVPKRN